MVTVLYHNRSVLCVRLAQSIHQLELDKQLQQAKVQQNGTERNSTEKSLSAASRSDKLTSLTMSGDSITGITSDVGASGEDDRSIRAQQRDYHSAMASMFEGMGGMEEMELMDLPADTSTGRTGSIGSFQESPSREASTIAIPPSPLERVSELSHGRVEYVGNTSLNYTANSHSILSTATAAGITTGDILDVEGIPIPSNHVPVDSATNPATNASNVHDLQGMQKDQQIVAELLESAETLCNNNSSNRNSGGNDSSSNSSTCNKDLVVECIRLVLKMAVQQLLSAALSPPNNHNTACASNRGQAAGKESNKGGSLSGNTSSKDMDTTAACAAMCDHPTVLQLLYVLRHD